VEFICAYHQRRLEALSLSQQQDLWLLWMESALWHYEQLNWRLGVSFAGSAFDLARLAHRRQETACMPVEMTLAAILLARVLREQGEQNLADGILTQARHLLGESHQRFKGESPQRFGEEGPQRFEEESPQRFEEESPQRFDHQPLRQLPSEELEECLRVLKRPARQGAFFEAYLNWPSVFNDRHLAGAVFH